MELGTCDVDAQLLEQLNALGTNDKEDLINQLKSLVGPCISLDACRFFLELSGWNLQRAVGAYFDFSFENAPAAHANLISFCNFNQNTVANPVETSSDISPSFDVRILPSPSGSVGSCDIFKVMIENSGSSPWTDNFYIRSEDDQSIAKLATRSNFSGQLAWLPIGAEGRIPLPSVSPGQSAELVIKTILPNTLAAGLPLKPVIGGLSFCLPNGDRFGETLYCTAIPDISNQTWIFQRGVPEMPEGVEGNTPMDEA